MCEEGYLKLTLKTPTDAQDALKTVKRILKEKDCEDWYECVDSDENRIIIGDGSSYHIGYFEFDGILAEIGKALASEKPERAFSGIATFANLSTSLCCDDYISYDNKTRILFVRENYSAEEGSYYETECETCGETIGISLGEYEGQKECRCPNCGETVSLDGIDDMFDTHEQNILIQ